METEWGQRSIIEQREHDTPRARGLRHRGRRVKRAQSAVKDSEQRERDLRRTRPGWSSRDDWFTMTP